MSKRSAESAAPMAATSQPGSADPTSEQPPALMRLCVVTLARKRVYIHV